MDLLIWVMVTRGRTYWRGSRLDENWSFSFWTADGNLPWNGKPRYQK